MQLTIVLSALLTGISYEGIKVADIAITDDALGTNNLSLSGTDASFFEIVGNELRLKAGTVLDYETKSSYNVIVEVDDSTVGSTPDAGTNYTLDITDVNEAPTNLILSTNTVNENVAANTLVGTFSSTDPDTANTFTYSLVSGSGANDNSAFIINGNQLKINVSPDFETKSSYNIRVQTTDADGLFFDKGLTINVNNINELNGSNTRDPLTGTTGIDYITGGSGAKTLTGHAGNDLFIYNSLNDVGHRITDFTPGQDKIVLTQLLDSLVPGGYNGTNAFADRYVRVVQGTGTTATRAIV